MHKKVRLRYGLSTPRNWVYDVTTDVDPEGLENRRPGAKTKKKGAFHSPGPNWVFSLDGHDNLMGFQNSTFPIAIYGCIDTASRKLIWIKVWNSNSSPLLIGRWYLDYLYGSETLPNNIMIDKGTETGVMATMHALLRRRQSDISTDEEACDTHLFFIRIIFIRITRLRFPKK